VLNCFVSFAESPAPAGDGPLRGIPYAYKDVFAHAGMAPGLGLRRPEPRAGVGDAAALARLEAQGAVPLGRLQLDPLAYSTTGLNPSLGDVRNRSRRSGSPAARRAAPRPPSPPAQSRSQSAPTPAARSASRPPTAA
jgi:hypothetical protein